jgi:UPF0271 protein
MTSRRTIDLNCDLGEGSGHDAAVMPLISSANIASGGHAGDRQSMLTAVGLARDHGVAIGCHPGHADPDHFGRRPLPISPAAAADLVVGQLARFATIAGADLRHLKLHGALYHQVGDDEDLAAAVSRRLATDWPHLVLFAAAGSRLAAVAHAEGLQVAAEAFADRRYSVDGRLLPRSDAKAVIDCPTTAAQQAAALVVTGQVSSVAGEVVAITADTLCVHGDGVDPAGCLRAIHHALAANSIAIRHPFQ